MAKRAGNTSEITENTEENITAGKPISERHKTEKCRVLFYNTKTKELDIDFKGYGIRLYDIRNIGSDYVTIKYYGDIGEPNFSCGL